jgi:hypothetical protein
MYGTDTNVIVLRTLTPVPADAGLNPDDMV